MQPRIQDFARLSVVTYTVFPQLLTGGVTMAHVIDEIGADEYFDAVDVTWISDPKARANAIQAARNSNLSVLFALQPYQLARKLDLASLDDAARKQALSICRQAIDQAAEWEACAFSVLSGPDPGPDKRPAAIDQLLRSLEELCRHTSSRGMPLLLATSDRKPFGQNQLLGPTAEAVPLLRRLNSGTSRCGLMISLANLPLLEESPAHALQHAKDHVSAVRIGNCVIKNPSHPAYGNQHPPLDIPEGEIGEEQLCEFIAELFRVGFLDSDRIRLGQMSFEVTPIGAQNPVEVIGQTKEMLDLALLSTRPAPEKASAEST